METTKVAVVGMGTVGSGVARLLLDHGDRTARHAGRTLWLESVVVRDLAKVRDADLPAGLLSDDLSVITDNPEIRVVAQLIGGLEPARTIMLKLLESGKDIVTANKALLAEHGPELFDRARELGRSIAFEASVAGGIPIVANISQCLSANQVLSLRGILNGTSNYILTQMEEQGDSYNAAVADAQRRGYAEADPTMDVDGADAAQKLAILAHLAFGARVHWRDIPRAGIDTLDLTDLSHAQELGYRIKLLAVAQLLESGLELHVSPTLVKHGSPLAEVRGAFNAVSVVGDAVGPVFFHGLGAGQMPTASAVVADMIDTAVGRTNITFRTLELWSQQEARVQPCDPAQVRSRYYLRLSVDDQPGVMAKVTGVLGDHGISIASIVQHEPDDETPHAVPLIIMTHAASEQASSPAMKALDQLSCVHPPSVCMRVLD
ncbi:homoserine dehydrogenase [Lignipirellula cremea]|uniref:Homoserine dehydrogenase n=1 Tax=Lignipirellula cremea TaxID=2528010 RepID=A0A518DW49_9BACT|nr:homoserine dehydrogenase [Lignipirellula cremea]QDU96066.1 Homoserine dehydrogenase [Lignipirellula cremea]